MQHHLIQQHKQLYEKLKPVCTEYSPKAVIAFVELYYALSNPSHFASANIHSRHTAYVETLLRQREEKNDLEFIVLELYRVFQDIQQDIELESKFTLR